MASTEARAKWCHYANRCVVQEDYRGAPNPGSRPPSSSKSQPEQNPGDRMKPYDDTKWWLHQQPKDNSASILETSWETSEMEAVIGNTSQKKLKVGEVGFENDHPLLSEKPEKLISESEPQLIGINKMEPWWRTTDLNELATFISEKSLEHFENHDLPPPKRNKTSRQFVPDKGLASLNYVSNSTDSTKPISPASRFSPSDLDNPLSIKTTDEAEDLVAYSSELSKAQLLEALCHSQTRAREAEKAAQQAYNEKEHVIDHFLKQASHLFAYKQWFHLLQLETSCLHLRDSRYQLIYTRFPYFVPWVPRGKQQKMWVRRKAAKKKQGSPRFKLGKSFGSFLLGLTIVGAGLLLGWTLGWLFR